MIRKEILGGVAHQLPKDLLKVIQSSPKLLSAWEAITPLARNEWICWVESTKKNETRNHRIQRASKELANGKRRPCCWPGCNHR